MLKICAVRDRQLEAFMQPMFVLATGAAVRSFIDEMARDGSPLKSHPEDYDLYLIGEYDDSTGLLTAFELRKLASGLDHVNTT